MRVLYLNPFSQQVSGPDESLLGLLEQLVSIGVEPHLVLPAPGPQVNRYERLGVTVHFAPLTILHRKLSLTELATFGPRLARAVSAVTRIARAISADLIHTNMEVVLDGGIVARRLGLPHVLHYRGNTLDRPRLIFDGLTLLWTTFASRILCISRATASVFERRGRGEKVEVVYNPIDTAAFSSAPVAAEVRAQLGAGPGELLVGTIGRIHPRKDVATFVRACARLQAGHSNVRFVVVGPAEAPVELAYLQQVRALSDSLGLRDRLCFAGARRDMPAVMRALDVFVLASRHEGFGRVVGEAMAAGRPVVVTREGALTELVDEGESGLCAAAGDADDFALKIGSLLSQPALRESLGASARSRAATFDGHRVATQVAGIYRQLVAAAQQ
jgi:glycosyltransferase involved in cell wall biosynthesis